MADGIIDYVYLETTNYCNLDCSFCNRKEVVAQQGALKHMSIEDFKTILSKLKHFPIKEAKLMGMGEPFLHPKFDEICRLFKETFPDAFLIVATNCQYGITDKFRRALKYLDMLYLSVDGYEETYERFRGNAKWSHLLRFLEKFKTVDRHNCDVHINFVVNDINYKDIEKVYNLSKEHNLGEMRINLAQWWGEDETIDIPYPEDFFEFIKPYSHLVRGILGWDFKDCFWTKRGLYMDVFGDVKVCCLNTVTEPIGNLFNQSIEEIRKNPRFLEIKASLEKNEPTEHCRTCDYKGFQPLLKRINCEQPCKR